MKGGYLGAFAAITGNEVSNALKVTVFGLASSHNGTDRIDLISICGQFNRQSCRVDN